MNNIILIVDDTKVLANLYCNFLKKSGYNSVAAYSSRECLNLLEDINPDLILLDIMMEPVDGWKTLLKIREDERFSDTAIIMMTAKSILPCDIVIYGSLIDGYVIKPVKPIELIDLIDIAERRKRKLSITGASAVNSGADEIAVSKYLKLLRELEIILELKDLVLRTYNYSENSDEFGESFRNDMLKVESMIEERKSLLNSFRVSYPGL